MMETFQSVLLAFLGGVLPALIWLGFWLRQDKKNPEPRRLIFLSFAYGMLAVPGAFVIQFLLNLFWSIDVNIDTLFHTSYWSAVLLLIFWAAVEEILKYFAAYKGGLSKKHNDEPIDVVIYMITAALGFAALENALYLIEPLLAGNTELALLTGNFRFIGSTLLHVSTSAIVGMFLAFSYYKNREIQKRHLLTGLILSIALHTIFNSFIIRAEEFTLLGFAAVWVIIIIIILLFEKVKKVYN